MKRNYSIIISVITIIVLIGIWLFLLYNRGDIGNRPDDTFSNLNDDVLAPSTDEEVSDTRSDSSIINDSVVQQPRVLLKQLTTKNVIGYREIQVSTTTPPVVYFAESGVGHIYEIDLESNTEKRISATTIPNARVATFSSDGKTVAFKTGESDGVGRVQIGTISNGRIEEFLDVGTNVTAMKMVGDSLVYAVLTNSSTQVRRYVLTSQTDQVLFNVPFRESVVQIGEQIIGPHFIHPKTSHLLEGFVMQYQNGVLSRLPISGYGVVAVGGEGGVVSTIRNKSSVESHFHISNTLQSIDHAAVVPEKCTFISAEQFICARDNQIRLNNTSVESWYRGDFLFNDSLHLFNVQGESIAESMLISIENESGRSVDVINASIGRFSNGFYFKNKMDNTLWWYDASAVIVTEN